MAGGNDGDAPGGQRGATVQKMYHRFFSGKSPEPIQVKTTRPLPSISSTSFQAAASGGDDEMSAFPDTMPSASRAEVPPISFNRATQQAAPLNERRRKGVSIQYLASILQPRSLAELGSDATVDDLIKGILEPMVERARVGDPSANTAVVDTLKDNQDVVGTPTVAVCCPLSCSFLSLVQALIAWTNGSGRTAKNEYVWIGWLCTDLWVPGRELQQYEFLTNDFPDMVTDNGKLLLFSDPAAGQDKAQKETKRRPTKWSTAKPERPAGLKVPACYTNILCLYELFQALEADTSIESVWSPAEQTSQRAEIANFGISRILRAIDDIKISEQVNKDVATKIQATGSASLMEVCVHKYLSGSVVINADTVLKDMVNRSVHFGQHVGGQGWSRIRPLVITGPVGCQKPEMINMLMDAFPSVFGIAIKHTNAKPAQGEQGIHDPTYHHTSRDVMLSMAVDGDFVETNKVDNIIYGSSRAAVSKLAKAGKICILDVPVLSVESVLAARLDPAPIIVYVKPSSAGEFKTRLAKEDPSMSTAQLEDIAEKAKADFELITKLSKEAIILADDVESTFQNLQVHLKDDMEKAALVRQHNFSLGIVGTTTAANQQPEHFSPEKLFQSIARLGNDLCPELLKMSALPGFARPAEKARTAATEGYKANKLVHGDYVHEALATAVFNMGMALAADNSEENLKFCRKALKMRCALFGHESAQVAEAHRILGGHCELLLMDYDTALKHWNEAIRIYEHLGKTWTVVSADCIFNVGCIKGKLNDLKGMRNALRKAIRLYKHLLGDQHPTTLRTLDILAATKAKLACLEGDHERASRIFERASMMYGDGGRRRTTMNPSRAKALWARGKSKAAVMSLMSKKSENVQPFIDMMGTNILVAGKQTPTKRWKRPGSIVAVFFGTSAEVEFTQRLKDIYEEVNGSNVLFDLLFVSGDMDEAAFEEHTKDMPWGVLPFTAEKHNVMLRKTFNLRAFPRVCMMNSAMDVLSQNATFAIQDDGTESFPWSSVSFRDTIGTTVIKSDGTDISTSALDNKMVGLYFASEDNDENMQFSKLLAGVYNKLSLRQPAGGKHARFSTGAAPQFEVLHVPHRNTSDADYMFALQNLPWLGIPVENKKMRSQLCAKFDVLALPALVILRANGDVVNPDARLTLEMDPHGHNFPWVPRSVSHLHELSDLNCNTVLIIMADKCRSEQADIYFDRLDCLYKDWVVRARAASSKLNYKFALAARDDPSAASVRDVCQLPDIPDVPLAIILDMRDNRSFYLGKENTAESEATLSQFLSEFEKGSLTRHKVIIQDD